MSGHKEVGRATGSMPEAAFRGVTVQRKPPKKPRPTSSPQAGLISPSALPQSISTRLFPPCTGTRPCRHRGAQHTLGTGAHGGKPEASPTLLSRLWRRAAGKPPGSARGRGWRQEEVMTATSECQRQAFRAWRAQVGGGAAHSGPRSHKFGNVLRAQLSKGDRSGKYKNTPCALIRVRPGRGSLSVVLRGRISD